MSSSTRADINRPWLFGALPDLLLGCGVGYVMIFMLQIVAGAELRSWVPLWVAPLLLMFASWPHHGATLLIAYEQEGNRRKYVYFTLWSTLLVWTVFAGGVYSPSVGSAFITLYVAWIPWHLTGQNYGIALMFAHRVGVAPSPILKRAIYASFVLSFMLMLLATMVTDPLAAPPTSAYDSADYTIWRVSLPAAVKSFAIGGTGVLYLAATLFALGSLLRRAALRQLVPVVALFATQSLWLTVPVISQHFRILSSIDPLSPMNQAYATLWVAVGHGVQYQWITAYYARRSEPATGVGRHLLKAMFAGCAIWTVPALLFAPGMLGRVPFSEGLGVLVAAGVNLHHFVLDGAIWKLRDQRVSRILLRPRATNAARPSPIGTRRFSPAPAVWSLATVCVAVSLVIGFDSAFGAAALMSGRAQSAEAAMERLARLGRDSAKLRANLGVLKASHGDTEGGLAEISSSLALYPTSRAWHAKAWIYENSGDQYLAIRSYEESLKLESSWRVQNDLAWILATTPNLALQDPAKAVSLAEAAMSATNGNNPGVLDTLAAAYASAHRFSTAVRVAQRAETLTAEIGDEAFTAEIAERRSGYLRRQAYRDRAAATSGDGEFELLVKLKVY
jgi:Tfp pilus assembly protein PilF